jgi:hypothetical protein
MVATKTHKHTTIDEREKGPYGFIGCVARHPFTDCNPASHGGVVWIETCECGATRKRSSNGRHAEFGCWESH